MKVNIGGMTCGHCKKRVEEAIGNLPRVESVNVNLEGAYADVKGSVSEDAVKTAVEDAGYDVKGFEK